MKGEVQSIAAQLTAAGVEFKTPFNIGKLPEAGLSNREVYKRAEHLEYELHLTTDALARGNTAVIREELDELLDVDQINLDPKSEAYRRLAMAVLGAHVKALKDIDRRNGGEPVRLGNPEAHADYITARPVAAVGPH